MEKIHRVFYGINNSKGFALLPISHADNFQLFKSCNTVSFHLSNFYKSPEISTCVLSTVSFTKETSMIWKAVGDTPFHIQKDQWKQMPLPFHGHVPCHFTTSVTPLSLLPCSLFRIEHCYQAESQFSA